MEEMAGNTPGGACAAAVRDRWSPTIFTDSDVTDEELLALFEATRWAPSSMNEQPWRFLHATRRSPEAFDRMVSCLVESNARWARHAPLLLLLVTRTRFSGSEKENRHAWYDAGMATENLLVQASSMGLQGHVMAGFSRSKAVDLFGIPDGFETVVMIALGHPGKEEVAPEGVTARKKEDRTRRPLRDTVFTDRWGASPETL